MEYLIYQGGSIRWSLNRKDANQLFLKSIPKISILNPLKYLDEYKKRSLLSVHFKLGEQVLLKTNGLIIASTDRITDDPNKQFTLIESINAILRYLRCEGLQYDLDHSIISVFYKQIGSIKTGISEINIDSFAIPTLGVRSDYYYSFVTWKALRRADKLKSENAIVPIHEEVLLDAIQAKKSEDYRRAILYSCIACESLVSFNLEARYQYLIMKNKAPFSFSINKNTVIDPIYSLLKKNDGFLNKIHQHYLYLFKKSVLINNKDLYDKLDVLYATRNSIAHSGDIKPQSKKPLLSFDSNGMKMALLTALIFFEWTGNSRFNVFKAPKHILIK